MSYMTHKYKKLFTTYYFLHTYISLYYVIEMSNFSYILLILYIDVKHI